MKLSIFTLVVPFSITACSGFFLNYQGNRQLPCLISYEYMQVYKMEIPTMNSADNVSLVKSCGLEYEFIWNNEALTAVSSESEYSQLSVQILCFSWSIAKFCNISLQNRKREEENHNQSITFMDHDLDFGNSYMHCIYG